MRLLKNKLLILAVCFSFAVPFALVADGTTMNLRSVVLETFDPDTRSREWIVTGSKFIQEGFPKKVYVDAYPMALFRDNPEGNQLQVLGVNAQFNRLGFNSFEMIPAAQGDGGELVVAPIDLPGRVKTIDLWAWGANYNYYMEIQLMDYKGTIWNLYVDSLQFKGWRNLTVKIPPAIPQGMVYAPSLKTLKLMKIIVWTQPGERVDNYYFYLDQIKCLTDDFVTRFDGDELADPAKTEEIWQGAQPAEPAAEPQ